MRNARLGPAGDLSHVAVGPGGVWIVESKWRHDLRGDGAGIPAAVRKASGRRGRRRLAPRPRARRHALHPLVVVWMLDGRLRRPPATGCPSSPGDRTPAVASGHHVGGSASTPDHVELAWDRLLYQAQLRGRRRPAQAHRRVARPSRYPGSQPIHGEWGAEAMAAGTLGTLTVLFTDLVGSTALHDRGSGPTPPTSCGAPRPARAPGHRAQPAARVVKDLGDGIHGPFRSAADAADRAVAIQQAIDRDRPSAARPRCTSGSAWRSAT